MAQEIGVHGIRINTLSPGVSNSPLSLITITYTNVRFSTSAQQ
jgi:NAD(P)-dependent dehydrogenase (short-subunit alcohol dehydrogenase family)